MSRIQKEEITVDPKFLAELSFVVTSSRSGGEKSLVGVEGYRPRGKSLKKDRQMTTMVQRIHNAVKGSQIVDNTGVKNTVTSAFMATFGFGFPTTHHQDLESAARIAFKLGYKDDQANRILSDYIRDFLMGEPWRRK